MSPGRSLRIAAAVFVVLAVADALVVWLAGGWLNRQVWFGVDANLIQHASGPPTFAAVVAFAVGYWQRRCPVPVAHVGRLRLGCPLVGVHPVSGTLQKVCGRHHHRSSHEFVYAIHAEEHRLSGRLGFGESHDLHEKKTRTS